MTLFKSIFRQTRTEQRIWKNSWAELRKEWSLLAGIDLYHKQQYKVNNTEKFANWQKFSSHGGGCVSYTHSHWIIFFGRTCGGSNNFKSNFSMFQGKKWKWQPFINGVRTSWLKWGKSHARFVSNNHGKHVLLSMLIFGLGPLTVYIKESTEEKGLACLSGAKSMAHYRVLKM